MTNTPLLTVKNLRTHFATDRGVLKAVDGVDLSIGRSETVGLAGESGSGKSVFARSILRLVQSPGRIVEGEVLFEGEDLLKKPEREMRQVRGRAIAFAPQDPLTSLNPVLRVGPQVAEVVRRHGVRAGDDPAVRRWSRRAARERAVEVMEAVRIPEVSQRYSHYPHQLSGGMRQRAVLASALACNPSLLIADEPTTALDVTVQAAILDLLQEAKRRQGTSVLLITHDLGVICHFCERVAVMYAGRIVEWGDTRDVLTSPMHPYTEGLLRCLPRLRGSAELHPIPGRVPDLLDLPPGCAFGPRCPRAVPVCTELDPPVVDLGGGRWTRCHLFGGTGRREGPDG